MYGGVVFLAGILLFVPLLLLAESPMDEGQENATPLDTLVYINGTRHLITIVSEEPNRIVIQEPAKSYTVYMPRDMIIYARYANGDYAVTLTGTQPFSGIDRVETPDELSSEKSKPVFFHDSDPGPTIEDRFFSSLRNTLLIGGYSDPLKSSSSNVDEDFSVYFSFRRFLSKKSILYLGRADERRDYFIATSFLWSLRHNDYPYNDNWVYQFFVSYGVRQPFGESQKSSPYHFREIGLSVGERYDSNGFSSGPGLIGSLGVGTRVNVFVLEARIGFETLSMQVIPIVSVGYRL